MYTRVKYKTFYWLIGCEKKCYLTEFFFGLHKVKKAVKAKKGQKKFFAKSLRIVQFGEKSNKNFFVGLAFKAKTILAQGSKGLFYDENPFLSIKYSLYSNIRHTSFLKIFILYSNAQCSQTTLKDILLDVHTELVNPT